MSIMHGEGDIFTRTDVS